MKRQNKTESVHKTKTLQGIILGKTNTGNKNTLLHGTCSGKHPTVLEYKHVWS